MVIDLRNGVGGDDGVPDLVKYDRVFQDEVLKQWEELRQMTTQKEMTRNRMMLAEWFLRQIENRVADTIYPNPATPTDNKKDTKDVKTAQDYTRYVNNMLSSRAVTVLSSSAFTATEGPASSDPSASY